MKTYFKINATAFVTVLESGWPRVTGSVTPNAGELPLAASFTIDGIPSSSPIVNYEIDFADGSSKFSGSSTPFSTRSVPKNQNRTKAPTITRIIIKVFMLSSVLM